jgi:hypothetical protein
MFQFGWYYPGMALTAIGLIGWFWPRRSQERLAS